MAEIDYRHATLWAVECEDGVTRLLDDVADDDGRRRSSVSGWFAQYDGGGWSGPMALLDGAMRYIFETFGVCPAPACGSSLAVGKTKCPSCGSELPELVP